MASQSRWGWYPYDYETFLLVKEVHARYWKALRCYADWQRWQRKQPQNRVIRRRIRDAQGHVVGTEIVGPRPEPPLDPLFCTRAKVVRHRTEGGKPVRESTAGERVAFCDHGIPEAYRAARRPAPNREQVVPLKLSRERIHQLAAEARQVSPETR